MVSGFALLGLAISLFLLVYPYLIYPALLRLLPKVACLTDGEADASFALMLCAHNEAAVLPDTLARLRVIKGSWPELQIMAHDDGSTDGTAQMLDSVNDFLAVTHSSTQLGKAAGLRRMLQACRADVVLFMDANILVMADDMNRFRRYFADPTIGAVGGRLLQSVRGQAAARVGGLYWKLEERLKSLETETGSTMGCNGALWGIRRQLYPQFDLCQSDDFRPSMQPLFEGQRVITAPDIRGVEVMDTAGGEAFKRKLRIACGAWHAHVAMRPMLGRMGLVNRWKYLSHKWLRWLSAVWLALAVGFASVLAAQIGLLPAFVGVSLVVAGLATAGVRPFATVGQIALAMLATLCGIVLALAGRSRVTWTPARAD